MCRLKEEVEYQTQAQAQIKNFAGTQTVVVVVVVDSHIQRSIVLATTTTVEIIIIGTQQVRHKEARRRSTGHSDNSPRTSGAYRRQDDVQVRTTMFYCLECSASISESVLQATEKTV